MSSLSHKNKRKDSSTVNVPSKRSKLSHSHHADGEFQVVNAALVVSVPPIFAANPRAGVEEMLDSMIMRYIPSLKGVVLSHSNLVFLRQVATIQRDCPFLICSISFDATVWSPVIGTTLSGRINLCSPDHISLLVHRTFNVSIPRNHIPADEWVFEYGAADNDPEFGDTSLQEGHDGDGHLDKNGGRWVHRITNQRLGGDDGLLDFTVIGLTIANEMLSLLGSFQPDPFSPRHLVSKQREERKTDSEKEESEEDAKTSGDDSEEGGSDSEGS